MKNIISKIGVGIFWVLWPLWYIYFKLQPKRSRVLVIAGDEFLVLYSWVSSEHYGLPGGGQKRGETTEQSASRELEEETGIDVPVSALEHLGRRKSNLHGLSYRCTYFVLRLPEKPTLKLRPFEIMDSTWLRFEDIDDVTLSQEVRFALRRYKPATQEILL